MNIKFIVNPVSGKQLGLQRVEAVIKQLYADGALQNADVFQTSVSNDALQEASDLQGGQYDLVIAVGGDGTVHEVVNGLVGSGSNIPLAIMPAGTVNDFGQFLQVPEDVAAYCRMISNFKTLAVDVGQVGEDYFLNVFAGGLFTDISYKVPREAKMVLGELAYYLAGAVSLPLNLFKSYSLVFELKEECFSEQALIFIVSNSPSVGGFKQICPDASVSDGLLDVCIVKRSALELALPFFFRLMRGEHIDSPHVRYFQTECLKISRAEPFESELFIDMDGEQKGSLPAQVRVVPGALRILVP